MAGLTLRHKLIYILSPSYSGSTLLTLLMANHPQIGTIGELKATSMGDIESYRCSCGNYITSCEFWGTLTRSLQSEGSDLDLSDFNTHFSSSGWLRNKVMSARVQGIFLELLRHLALSYFPPIRSEEITLLDRNELLMKHICRVQNSEVFLDGSKDSNRLLHFVRSNRWDIKVVNLVRDELGLLNSWMRRENRTMADAAVRLIETRKEQKRVLELVGEENVVQVDYNELCTNPNDELNRIYSHSGLQPVSNVAIGKGAHHILGNSMRLSKLEEIKPDNRWKEELSMEDLDVYEKFRGKINSILLPVS